MSTPTHLYRFRSPAAVLHEWHELERQEVHLTSLDELNDPMEGYRDVLWQGDEILWRNLIKHYLLCLTHAFALCQLFSDQDFEEPEIYCALNEADLPTDKFRELYREIVAAVFAAEQARRILQLLESASAPLRREELSFHLFTLHPFAIQTIVRVFRNHGLTNSFAIDLPDLGDGLTRTLLNSAQTANAKFLRPFWEVATNTNDELRLIFLHNNRQARPNESSSKRDWLIVYFVDRYLSALVNSLIHPPCHIACFSAVCDNASMWSTYADRHRGVALKFTPSTEPTGRQFLTFHDVTGSTYVKGRVPESQTVFGPCRYSLHEVQYSAAPTEIDFFTNLGTLPTGKVRSTWHCDESGRTSSRVHDIMGERETWKAAYWKQLYESTTRKLSDWQHEQEYRLVVPDTFGHRCEMPNVSYDFSALTGIVFGMRTSDADKLAIFDVIERKCRESRRSNFEFLQARYSSTSGKLVVWPLSLLKFS